MPGRRWSDGLHQAVEAKEGIKVQQEQKTIATITVQNYFRQYEKLAGMTGTAGTQGGKIPKIYGPGGGGLPAHRPVGWGGQPGGILQTGEAELGAGSGES